MFNDLSETLGGVDAEFRGTQFTTISQFLAMFVNLMIGVSISVSVITLAYSFIMFLQSLGDPKRVQTAQNAFLFSCIGFLVTIAAIAIKSMLVKAAGGTDASVENF